MSMSLEREAEIWQMLEEPWKWARPDWEAVLREVLEERERIKAEMGGLASELDEATKYCLGCGNAHVDCWCSG